MNFEWFSSQPVTIEIALEVIYAMDAATKPVKPSELDFTPTDEERKQFLQQLAFESQLLQTEEDDMEKRLDHRHKYGMAMATAWRK